MYRELASLFNVEINQTLFVLENNDYTCVSVGKINYYFDTQMFTETHNALITHEYQRWFS